MDVPVHPCEELLQNQFEAAAHPRHLNEANNDSAASWILVMATHNRTGEALKSLEAACSSAVATSPPLDVIVYVDETNNDRDATVERLSHLRQPPRFLHGGGATYWS